MSTDKAIHFGFPASPQKPAIEDSRKLASLLLAEGRLRSFLVALNERTIYPAPQLVTDLGPLAALVPWQRGGQVTFNEMAASDDKHFRFFRVWQRGRRALLIHLGEWSGAVVAVKPGDIITIPSLLVRRWRVTEAGIEPL